MIDPPVFVLHPSSQYIYPTQTATFTCNASGHNVTYQWRIGSGSFPTKVMGIQSGTLIIPDVRSSDENTYTCIASDELWSVSSDAANLRLTGKNNMIIRLITTERHCLQKGIICSFVLKRLIKYFTK